MKIFWRIILAFLLPAALMAQPDDTTLNLPELLQGAQQWAQENIDTNVLNALPDVDDPATRKFLRDIEQRFRGGNVVDLADLRQTASIVLPWLRSREETQPYAAWLAAQMDYLDVAEEIRQTPPTPNTKTNQPAAPQPNPSAQIERRIWIRHTAARPWSAGEKKYVFELKPIFEAQKIPPELVWLADVESSFDPRARSPAGAAGLFQLMPDTAKRFGLSLWPRDQRYQPKPSATVSAEYLKYLFGRFQDWRLVLAAYNAGEGTVQKLLQHHKTRQYDDIAKHLPAETQMYVPRIEAILAQREGAKLELLPAPRL